MKNIPAYKLLPIVCAFLIRVPRQKCQLRQAESVISRKLLNAVRTEPSSVLVIGARYGLSAPVYGKAAVGAYPYDIAMTKVQTAMARARQEGFPFRLTIEER